MVSINEKSKLIKIIQNEQLTEEDKEELRYILSKLPSKELKSLLGKKYELFIKNYVNISDFTNRKNWSLLDLGKDKNPRSYEEAVQNAADHLLNNVITDEFKQFYNLKEGEAPHSRWVRDYNNYEHRGFFQAMYTRNLNYYDVVEKADLVVVDKYKDWSFLDWGKDGNLRSYEEALRNMANYLLNNVMTDEFKQFYNLKEGEAPHGRWVQEYNNYEHRGFFQAMYRRGLNYYDVVEKAGLVVVDKYKDWSFLDWGKDGNPRSYEEAVQNAADHLLNNVMTEEFKRKNKIKENRAPSSNQIKQEFPDFSGAIYMRHISYKDVRTATGLKRSPIYPKEYWRDTPIIGNLQKVKNFPQILNHFKFVQKNITFPDYILDNYENFPRISSFGSTDGALTHIRPKKIKYNFIESLIDTKKIIIILSGDCDTYSSICNLIELSKNSVIKTRYGQKAFINPVTRRLYTHGSAGHDYVLSFQIEKDNNSIGAEIPIWKRYENIYLTGHIDLIKIIDSTKIFVIDYKPEQTPILSMEALSLSFINSIPQVAFYGLVVKQKFGINELLCITFNKEGAWIYRPVVLLKEIRDFLTRFGRPCPWQRYL